MRFTEHLADLFSMTRFKEFSKYLRGFSHGVGLLCLLISVIFASLFFSSYKESQQLVKPYLLATYDGNFENIYSVYEKIPIAYPSVLDASVTIFLASYVADELKATIAEKNDGECPEELTNEIKHKEEIFEALSEYNDIPIISWSLDVKDKVGVIVEASNNEVSLGDDYLDKDMAKMNTLIKYHIMITIINVIGSMYLFRVLGYWLIFKPIYHFVIKPILLSKVGKEK